MNSTAFLKLLWINIVVDPPVVVLKAVSLEIIAMGETALTIWARIFEVIITRESQRPSASLMGSTLA